MEFRPYSEILAEYNDEKIPYSILLKANEWKEKKQQIANREKNICQICCNKCMDEFILKFVGNFVRHVPATYEDVDVEVDHVNIFGEVDFTYNDIRIQLVEQDIPRIPHVHHTYYLRNNLPWEYPENDLMLLCHDCHDRIHQTQKIPVYMNNKKFELCNFTPCERCNGTGYLHEYDYFQNGICFKCNGACFEEWE